MKFLSHFSVVGPVVVGLLLALTAPAVRAAEPPKTVEQWSIYELEFKGPSEGNPFTEVRFSATFTNGDISIDVPGFYDGEGIYRLRFMPELPGTWHYSTSSNRWALTKHLGSFTVTPPSPKNHGPVHVHDVYHFAYADGTPYRQIGTTSYTWVHRPEELQEQTLKTLAASPFNKLRMCVFPQTHGTDFMPPTSFPFIGTPKHWDFTRFNPAFFQHFEKRIGQLGDLGIECDLILFHPYEDKKEWGFDSMDPESDDRYLRYVVARFSAYHNLWWSMANEYDFIRTKTEADWDHFFQVVQQSDPYHHLRSIHNGRLIYDNNKPWVTHASIQNGSAVEDPGRAELYRDVYRKPIVYDEVEYEGNSDARWAQLSGQELVHRFWCGTVAGTYVGHSEYIKAPHDVVWIGQGGILRGESPKRLAFLRDILSDAPEIEPVDKWHDPRIGGKPGEYYLIYFGRETPSSWTFELYRDGIGDGTQFKIDVLDTWNMTITPVEGLFVAKKKDKYTFLDEKGRAVTLPGKPYQALRIRRVGGTVGEISDKPPGE